MHYANGRAAKAGDIVRGKGYNIKHEIVGLLVYANPGANACNCQVATVTKDSRVLHHAHPSELMFFLPPPFFGVMATLEYGQLDAFVAIDPQSGDVLPPSPEG